jgi:hypothetical protein
MKLNIMLNKKLTIAFTLLLYSCNNKYDEKIKETYWYEEISDMELTSPKYNSINNSLIKGSKMDTSKIMFWHFLENNYFEFCGYANGDINCPSEKKKEKTNNHGDGFENDVVFTNPGWEIRNNTLTIRDIEYLILKFTNDSIVLQPLEYNKKVKDVKILLKSIRLE